MTVWTITYLGTEKTAADWGLTAAPRIRTRDRSPTEFSFRMAGADPAAAIPFPFKAKVIITQYFTYDGEAWSDPGYIFTGYQTTQPADVDGRHQGVNLVFKDAIWLLQNTVFQQQWKQASTPASPVYVSRAVLFMDINSWTPNTYQSVQWQLQQIIAYAALCGISIAAGTIDYSGWFLNYYHCRAISCWDAILKCLEPISDAKVWVDGSTNPPQLNIRTRANIAAMAAPTTTAPGPISLPYKGTDPAGRKHVSSRSFTPRYDLVPPQVVLQYQINDTFNGKPAPRFQTDVYPAGSNGQIPFAMVCPIDLLGASITQESGTLDCEPLACVGGTHAQKRAWWASKRGGEQDKLADFRTRFGSATIGDATVTDDAGNPIDTSAYPQRIVAGSYHSWMKDGTTDLQSVRANVKVQVQLSEYDVNGSTPAETDTNGNLVHKSHTQELHCHITLSNAPSGVKEYYSAPSIDGQAETPVTGLAQNIYASRQMLDYDGSHEIIDPGIANGDGASAPLTQIIGHWNVLNFTGGAAAWATANMTISGTEIDLMTNHISITVGPAKHLQPQDWNSMLQFFRYRRLYVASSVRATGFGASGGTVDMAKNTPDANTVAGLKVDQQASQVSYVTPGNPASGMNGIINHDAGIIPTILGATTPTPVSGASATDIKTMQPREVKMCDDAGNIFYAIVHCGAGYTKP